MDERARIVLMQADSTYWEATLRLLVEAGYAVHLATSGSEGLGLAREVQADLVLLDLDLPDMDAVNVCGLVGGDLVPAQPHILLLAGDAVPSERRAAALEAGAAGCVLRNASGREILAHVATLLRLRRVETALRQSEERYRLLAENATDVVWMMDLKYSPLYISPSIEGLRGYTAEEAMTQPYIEMMTPESAQMAIDAFEEGWVLETTEGLDPTSVRTLELEYLCKDGSTVWTESKMNYVRDEYGLPIAIQGLTRDISERKAAEQALRRERDLLDRLMATSPVGITVVDRDGQITFANAAAEHVLGLTRDEVVARTYNAPAWHITDFEGNPFSDEELPFRRVAETQEGVRDVRHAIEWPDGQRRLLSINAEPLLDAAGEFEGMVATLYNVTEQVAAERALRESEQRFRSIFESIPMGMYGYQLADDGQLLLSAYNPAADDILGIDHSSFLGRPIEEAFPNLSETEVPAQYRRIAQEGDTWQTEELDYQDERVQGIFEVRAFQTLPGSMMAAFLDVTERKLAEEALQRRTAQLEALREIGLELTTDLNAETLLYSIVSHAMHLLGATVGALFVYRPNRNLLELAVAIGVKVQSPALSVVKGGGLAGIIWESGEPLIVDDCHQWPERSEVDIIYGQRAMIGVPVCWGEEFLGVVCLSTSKPRAFVGADVELLSMFATQASIAMQNVRLFQAELRRRQEAEALRQASLALGSTLDRDRVLDELLAQIDSVIPYDSANLMWVEDDKVRVTHQRGYELAGTAEETAKLRLVVDDVPNLKIIASTRQAHVVPDTWNDADWVQMKVTRWIRSWIGAPIVVRGEVSAFLCLDSATPNFYRSEHSHLLAAFAAHAAVAVENALLLSEAQAAYEELRQAQVQLVQSAKLAAVGELAAGVAHELNNPLTSVLGFAQILLRTTPPGDPAYRNLTTIATEALRARDIVRDLLDFSRQTDVVHERKDINQVVHTTLSLVRRQLETGGIKLEEDLAPGLPQPLLAVGRMKQVFLNLVTNAVQAMPRGGRLRVSSEQVDGEVAVHIADTGVGISEEHQERIFEPFYTTKPVGHGTGLGLSVSLGIVQEHGGRITVESKVGEGSLFTVWLPAGSAGEEVTRGE